MTPFRFSWKSSFCACRSDFCDGVQAFDPCDEEHRPWCQIVGSRELDQKLSLAVAAKMTAAFRFTLIRYGAKAPTFHRPSLVRRDLKAPAADMGFFLSESMGVELTACSEPERYADYLANKALRGLTEKMWLEDWTSGASLFPAELVADPALHLPREEANHLFGIHLDPSFVAAFKSIRRHERELESLSIPTFPSTSLSSVNST